jgi:mRNA interferase HigB
VHVISKKLLREFWTRHADAEEALRAWYRAAEKANWGNLLEIREQFPTTNSVEQWTVFDIRGNRYRLITRISYRSHTIFVRAVLTHAEYDRGNWK